MSFTRRLAQAGFVIGLANASATTPVLAQTRVPDWELRGRVETRPLAPGECAFVTLFVKDARGKLITRPDGNTIGQADFELELSGDGAASFKWERNTPDWYKVCATFNGTSDRADIVITYPRRMLPEDAVYPGVAFTAVIPVFRGSGGGTPDFSLLKLRGVGGAVAVAQPPIALPDPNRPPTQIGTVQTPTAAQPPVALPDPNRPPTQIGTVRTPTPAQPPVALPDPNRPPTQIGTVQAPAPAQPPVALPDPNRPPTQIGTVQTPAPAQPPVALPDPNQPPTQIGNVRPTPSTPPTPSASGGYEIQLLGARANRQTFDDPLNRDGWGDEIFASTIVSLIDRNTLAVRQSNVKTTQVYASFCSYPTCIVVPNGTVTGSMVPFSLPLLMSVASPGLPDRFPLQLFRGALSPSDAIVLAPSLWEWDGDNRGFQFWQTHQAPVVDSVATPAIATGDARWRRGGWCGIWHNISAETGPRLSSRTIVLDAGMDRPLMNVENTWCQEYLVLTRDAIERLLTQPLGTLPRGVIELRIVENTTAAHLDGDYSLFLKIERIP